MKGAVIVACFVVAATPHCGKTPASASPPTAGASSSAHAPLESAGEDAAKPMDPREADAWERAKEGDEEESTRLIDLVGCEGLREGASQVALRATALRSMAFCPDFSELPWLAEVATTGSDEDAADALQSIVEQAARPRRATDPDDADELGVGCGNLLALARANERPRARRVQAVRALRMLAERGCVRRSDIPSDLDAK